MTNHINKGDLGKTTEFYHKRMNTNKPIQKPLLQYDLSQRVEKFLMYKNKKRLYKIENAEKNT